MRTKTLVALGLAALLAAALGEAAGQAPARKPLTFDDFIRIKRVADPQPSPDGRSIAFVVTAMDREGNRGDSDIWIVPAAGGEARRLTSSPAADNTPRWSPDGKRIAFVSTRGGSPQVWTIDPAGGEAMPLTSLSTGASGIVWSPDGRALAFVSSVFPDCPDDACNRRRAEAAEKSKVKARLFETLLVRHWNAWSDGTRSHVFVVPAAGGTPVDVTPGDFDAPPLALGGAQDYVFSPDGAELAFVRNIDPDLKLGLGTNNDVFVVPAAGGPITAVTTSRANDHSPRYSPDGRYIAYLAMARPGFEADKQVLTLYDRTAKTITPLTADLDYSISEYVWAPDSKVLYAAAEDRGRNAILRIPAAAEAGRPEKILAGRTIGSLAALPDGKSLVVLEQAMDRPADVYRFDLADRRLTRLTDVNRDLLAGLALGPAEEFWFEGAEKTRVHGWLLLPPGFDRAKRYPLLMLIHGGPQGAWKDEFHYRWNAPLFAAPGFVTAMINFHGSTGYGQAFTDSITGDWGGKPYQDIMLGLAYLLKSRPYLDRDRVGAAGASYGGYMIDWIEGQTDAFRCLVTHSGVFDLRSMYGATEELWFPEWEYRGTPWTSPDQYAKWSPSSFVARFKTPCLVVHSANDYRVPLEQGLQMYTALQRMKVPSKLLYFPDEDHFIGKPQNAALWWKTVLEWLSAWLKP